MIVCFSEMLQHMQQQGQQYHAGGMGSVGGSSGSGHPMYLQGTGHIPQSTATKYMAVPMHRQMMSVSITEIFVDLLFSLHIYLLTL